jgi:putative DNA primase/helicase
MNIAKRTHVQLLDALGVAFDPTDARSAPPKRGNIFLNRARERMSVSRRGIVGGPIAEGSRNSALTSLAGSMRYHGGCEDEIREQLLEINRARVEPPLGEDEVSRIAASVSSYAPSIVHTEVGQSLNDTGNAARFVGHFEGRIRYVPQQERWLLWTDMDRWAEDQQGLVIEFAKWSARQIFAEAANCTSDASATAVARHANKSLDGPRLKAAVDLAKSDPRVVCASSQLDTRRSLLGVANGVIELETGSLEENRTELLITRHSSVVFDASATSPTFMAFLDKVTGGDEELKGYLMRMVGYAISGYTSEQVLFFLYGSGANGKSTFLNVLNQLMGPELCRQLPYDSLVTKKQGRSSTNDLARLDRVRMVHTSEVEDGSRLAESFVKQITGGEAIAARYLYGEFFEFVPQFKLLIAGNHKPIIQGGDDGIWRRLHLVPFEVTIPPAERDPQLGAKLEAELPGILNWAVHGYREWRKLGLAPPQRIRAAVEEYRSDMDLMGDWIASCCKQDTGAQAAAASLYQSYSWWAKDNGLHPMSGPLFGRRLKERFKSTRTSGGVVYLGISLKGRS